MYCSSSCTNLFDEADDFEGNAGDEDMMMLLLLLKGMMVMKI